MIVRICSADTTSKNRIEVHTVNMAQQIGKYNCGLFAIAYAIDLCLKKNPANVVYDQNYMRIHYNLCNFIPYEQVTRDVILDYETSTYKKGITLKCLV